MRGVLEGVPLSVLLGYRLERALREADLSVLILPLRTVFPIADAAAPGARNACRGRRHRTTSSTRSAARARGASGGDRRAPRDVRTAAACPSATRATRLAAQVDLLADALRRDRGRRARRGGAPDRPRPAGARPGGDAVPRPAGAAGRAGRDSEPRTSRQVRAALRRRPLGRRRRAPPGSRWPRLALGRRAAASTRWIANLLGAPTRWRFSGRSVEADGTPVKTATVGPADLGLVATGLVARGCQRRPDNPLSSKSESHDSLAAPPPARRRYRAARETSGSLGLAGSPRSPPPSIACSAARGPPTRARSTLPDGDAALRSTPPT